MKWKILIIILVVVLATFGLLLTQKKNPALDVLCISKGVDCSVYLSAGQKKPGTVVKVDEGGWYWSGIGSLKACWVGLPDICVPCDKSDSARFNACQAAFPGYQVEAGGVRK